MLLVIPLLPLPMSCHLLLFFLDPLRLIQDNGANILHIAAIQPTNSNASNILLWLLLPLPIPPIG